MVTWHERLARPGTLDPLQLGVLVLETATRTLTLVTIDAIAVDDELRHAIAASAGIESSALLLCASHTHSGPQEIVRRLHPIEPEHGDNALRDTVVTRATEAITQARAMMEPVSLSIADADASGAWTNRNTPDGPCDLRLRLLTTRREDGSLQTIVALSACHPTILGVESTVVSADLNGGIRRAIASLPDASRATVLSLTGAAGDISTRFIRQAATPAEIDRLAGIATRNVPAALGSLREVTPSNTSLTHSRIEMPLPSFREDLAADPQAELESARLALDVATATEPSPAALRQAITRHQGAFLRAQMAASVEIAPPMVVAEAWMLDAETVVVTLPVELFTSLGRRIERESPFAKTLIVGYTNGYAGYLADATAWDAGTYEALASPFARRAGDVLVRDVGAMLRALAGGPESYS
ncbi:MAG: hypothetical protein QM753_09520 [Thermomicrobiales bacterium]